MSDEPGSQEKAAEDQEEQKDEIRPLEDETSADEKTCPECGVPIYNLRKSCPNCGYEYQDDDYEDEGVGSEFTAGSEIPEEELGEKVTEDISGEEKTAPKGDEEEDEDRD